MKHIGIKLWSGMMLLVACVLILLWLFQIVFLDQFYTSLKISELIREGDAIAQELIESGGIAKAVEKSELQEKMENMAYQQQLSLEVVDFMGNTLYQVSNSDTMSGRGMMKNVNNEVFEIALSGEVAKLEAKHPRFGSKYMLIGIPLIAEQGIEGVVILNVPLAPVEDTAGILKQQLLWITAILIFASVLIAFFLSRSFTSPIVKLQRIAEKFSKGEFETRIEVKSSDELGKLGLSMNRMGEELAKNDQLRKDLIANVSHELRTPLSLIRGYAETLRDVTGEDPQKREKQLGVIIDESVRLSKIVEDILSLSRYQAGVVSLDIKEFSVIEMFEGIIERYRLSNLEQELRLEGLENTALYAIGDRGRIEQVIYNLINNAINHTQADGHILLKVIETQETVRLEVIDDGAGIEKDEMSHLFERYYKGKELERSKRSGTGLGLAIVKSILTMHQAPFGVSSSPGVGTTFWLELNKDNSHQSF